MGGCFSLPGRATENPVNGLLQQPGLARRAKSLCQSICNFFMELFYSRWVDGRFDKSMIIAKTRLMKGKLPNGPGENVMAGRKNDISLIKIHNPDNKKSLDQEELSNAREGTTVQQEPANKGGVVIPKEAVCYCPCCDLFFETWMKLKSHLRQAHRGKKYRRAFKCGHCWAGFKQLKSLERHVSTGKHSFPYPVRKITISTYEGDQVFEVLEVPAGFQGTTVSLRNGVL